MNENEVVEMTIYEQFELQRDSDILLVNSLGNDG